MKQQQDHIERINKVVKHIEQSIAKEMSLEELASIACFSPFHFQRLFKELKGESPKQFLKRLRLEKAAHVIVLFPEKSILEVAMSVGFQSLEAFSRAFKNYYAVSPDHFRKSKEHEKVKVIIQPNINGKMFKAPETFLSSNLDLSKFKDLQIDVVKRPALKFICLQTSLESTEQITLSFNQIYQWAQARDLIKTDTILFGLIKDFPLFTTLDKCRYLTCLSVDTVPELSGLFTYLELPGKTYASYKTMGGIQELIQTAIYLVHHWLPSRGYKIVHEPVIQIPLSDPTSTPFDQNSYQIFIQIMTK